MIPHAKRPRDGNKYVIVICICDITLQFLAHHGGSMPFPSQDHCHCHCRRDAKPEKCFAVSEVVADWHEQMVPQHIMRPCVALDN